MADSGAPDRLVGLTRGADAQWSSHRSGMLIQFGVSGELTGSRNVFMTRQRIPPGLRSTPHRHTNCETAMFVLAGPVVMRHGARLEHEHRAESGDFLHVPADAPHQLINPSDDHEAEVVLCRDAFGELVEDLEID
jgi:uncharacterized RmlC-like cupin family protein